MVKGLLLGVGALVAAACAVTVDPNYKLVSTTTGSGADTTTSGTTSCVAIGGTCAADEDCCGGESCCNGRCASGGCAPSCGAVGATGCTVDANCCQTSYAEACVTQQGVANTCFQCCTASAQCSPGCCLPGMGSACEAVCITGSSPECLQ